MAAWWHANHDAVLINLVVDGKVFGTNTTVVVDLFRVDSLIEVAVDGEGYCW